MLQMTAIVLISKNRLCYLIFSGAMIAWTGLLMFKHGIVTPMEETTCTQRYRTDEVPVIWRK